MIPTGWVDGRFTALVQLQTDPSPLAEAVWDVGVSIVAEGQVRDDHSARITLDRPHVPVVYESEVTFRPGTYELILVAHETVTDRIGTLAAMRKARRLMGAQALKSVVGEEIAPGAAYQKDDEMLDWVRHNAETTFHPVGTCKMGQDPMAVVDERLRVRGLEGLRVVDASIMPNVVSGNTNVPTMMIAEKAAEMIRRDRRATAPSPGKAAA